MRLPAAQLAALIEGLDWMRVRARRVGAQSEQFCSDLASALAIRCANSPVKMGENHMSNDVPPAFQNKGFFIFRQMGKFIDEGGCCEAKPYEAILWVV